MKKHYSIFAQCFLSAWNAHFRHLFHTKTIYANKCYVYEKCRLFYRNRLLKSAAVRHYAHIVVANLSIKIHNAKKISEKKRLFFIFSLIRVMSACFCRNFQVILYSANSGSAHRRHVPRKTGCRTAARGSLPCPPTPVGRERRVRRRTIH